MGRPAGKWPHYALENLEDSVYRLKQLESLASKAQDAIMLGDAATAQKHLGDVRAEALKCVDNLMRSRSGNYQQQEKASQWRPAEEKTAEAVARVVAIRRA